MTRTTKYVVRLLLFFIAFGGAIVAGGHEDYEVVQGKVICGWRPVPFRTLDNTIYADSASTPHNTEDNREECIRKFFERYNSPAAKYANLFVVVADENDLDWTLLPTLALIESGGGKMQRHNNIFGWDSGKARFASVEDAIRRVGRALTKGPYQNKTTISKLHVYNTHSSYARLATKLMKRIADQQLDVSANSGMIGLRTTANETTTTVQQKSDNEEETTVVVQTRK